MCCCVCDVSCQVSCLHQPVDKRNQQIGRKNIYLGISTNHSREMLQFQLDMSARCQVKIFIGQRSTTESTTILKLFYLKLKLEYT